MMNKFTTFWSRNWEPSSTMYDAEEWLTYEAIRDTKQTHDVFLEWIYEQEQSVRPRTTIYTLIGKRCIDVVASSFVIVFILSWLFPIIALFICFDSRGPFYFVQRRTGRKGKHFHCLKFRTMTHKPVKIEFQQTERNDDRVTRVGQFLRRTNLDEMLQFVNVLFGHMTLVGPRPHAVVHDAMHWSSNAYRARYIVKPGITGLAQIRGARGATSHSNAMTHRVRYDHFYINKQTLLLDLKICFDTVWITLQGDTNAW